MKTIAEDWDIETLRNDGVTSPVNNSSAIVRFDWKGRLSLLTGDAGIPALEMALDYLEADGFDPSQLGFVQVPHHGSRRNVGPAVLDRLLGPRRTIDESARSAFASVAKKGAPKHPAKKVANAFRRRGDARSRDGRVSEVPSRLCATTRRMVPVGAIALL